MERRQDLASVLPIRSDTNRPTVQPRKMEMSCQSPWNQGGQSRGLHDWVHGLSGPEFGRHGRMEHSVCRFCGKAFRSKSGVLQHEKTHRDEGPYKCCGKVFFSNANKTRHSCNVHGEEKQFQCSNCDKKFATKTDMERHKKRESGDFKFKCDICGAKESSKDKLEDHMGSHSGLKRHTCQICHKTFRYSGNLSRHRKTHEVQDEDELNDQ